MILLKHGRELKENLRRGRNTVHHYFKQIINHVNHLILEIRVQTIYDIIKAHGGELRVETKEGEGAEFIIQLPIQIKQIL